MPGRQLAVAQVQVGPADPARLDPQAQLSRLGRRLVDLGKPQRPARLVEERRQHHVPGRYLLATALRRLPARSVATVLTR